MATPTMKNLIVDTDDFLMADKRLAKVLGLQDAIMLQHIAGWTRTFQKVESKYPEEDRRHYHDGQWWVYNTYDGWVESLGYCSKRTVERSIETLRELGLIITTSEYNQKGYDQTLWYAIDYEKGDQFLALWHEMGCPKRNGGKMSQEYKEFHETWLEILNSPSPRQVGVPHDDKLTTTITSSWRDGSRQDDTDNTKDHQRSLQRIPRASESRTKKRALQRLPDGPPKGVPANQIGSNNGSPNEEPDSELVRYIEVAGEHRLGKKYRTMLEKPTVRVSDQGVVDRDPPNKMYDENEAYRKYVFKQVAYFKKRSKEEGQPFRNYVKRLVRTLTNLSVEYHSYDQFVNDLGVAAHAGAKTVKVEHAIPVPEHKIPMYDDPI